MSHQLTFADSEFSTKRRQTRKEIFLSRMEQILPWQNMTAVIEPFYPKAGNGRRPYPLETMLRIHCMQHWYNLRRCHGRCPVRNRLHAPVCPIIPG